MSDNFYDMDGMAFKYAMVLYTGKIKMKNSDAIIATDHSCKNIPFLKQIEKAHLKTKLLAFSSSV